MPDTTRIPREGLAAYFDAVTKKLMNDDAPDSIDAEILDLEIGDQEMIHGARLEGITYDAHSDTLEFALDVGDHRVLKPAEVWVTEAPNGIPISIEVVHTDGAREIIAVKHTASNREQPPSPPSA